MTSQKSWRVNQAEVKVKRPIGSIGSCKRLSPECAGESARDCPVWDISGKARTEGLPSIVNGESAVPECCETCLQLARIVKRGVEAGKTVEIDGLGVFSPDARRGFRFEPRDLPQVFLSYAKEDAGLANQLYDALNLARFSAWMDHKKLLPGQNWPRAIETAIESSDFFLACFSSRSVRKKGGFQAEIRYALDCARQLPLDEIYIVPVRLDNCEVPRTIQHELQYIDLFPEWQSGVERLLETLRRALKRRRRAPFE